jgi:hypothetical protein
MMKVNKWTLGLAAVGLVTIPVTMQAAESAVNTALSATTISGYVNTSAQWQIGKAWGRGYNAPGYAFNTQSKQDGFNLNVVNVVIEKPLDAQDSWAAGYKIDMIYGPDAVGWNSSVGSWSDYEGYDYGSMSDFGLKQAYVALRAPVGNGIDFKLGTFDTIIGYEVFNAGNNPNYTRSYGYTMEPTQHTGLLASYQFCKEFGIAGGIANTHNAGINNRAWLMDSTRSESYKTYMGAVTLSAPESMGFLAGSTLYGGVVNGFNTSASDNLTSLYAGATVNTPIKALKVGVAYDYLGSHGQRNSELGRSWMDAASFYMSFQATEKLSLHGRVEYAWGDPDNADVSKLLAVTGTLQYDLWANVLSRLEVRWDHAADGTHPFNDSDRNAVIVAANIIYKF